jgi:hypothetical protein
VRFSPQITGADGIDTTFFGQFFGTSAAAPDVAAVAALVLQAAGGPGRREPSWVYRKLQNTATRIPVSVRPDVATAFAGPTVAVADGDFPRVPRFFSIAVAPFSSRTVTQIQIDGTAANINFEDPAATALIGEAVGIDPSTVTFSRSADLTTLTVTFGGPVPAQPKRGGGFVAGSSLKFGAGAYDAREGFITINGDRFAGATYTVTLDDGHVSKGRFFADQLSSINRFAGFGLVNADKATR